MDPGPKAGVTTVVVAAPVPLLSYPGACSDTVPSSRSVQKG